MKINNMHKYLKMFNRKLLLTFSLIITILSSLSCVDGAGDKQVISVNPENVAIIVFNSIPGQFWGNGTDVDSIKINTGLIPNGSTITAKITNSSLPDDLSGCVVSGSATVINGQATFNFLAPIFIGNMGETQAVNLAVTIETPDGTKINDFVTLIILAVGIEPPADLTVQSSSMNDLDPGFLNVEFTTFGFAPGTMATCTVSNPALGSLASGMVPVSGTKAQGALLVQYLPAAGTPSGEQSVTCAIIIQNPSSVGASCSNVGVGDRTASATAFIDQGASDDVVNPPTPNSMTCTPNPVTGGNSGTCTCNSDNAAGATINFNNGSNITFPVSSTTADVNGNATVTYNSMVVAMTVFDQVTCGPAASMNIAQTSITINPGEATNLDCVPNPIASEDMPTQLICTCSTDSPLSEICLEEVADPGMAISGYSCTDSDANGNAVFTPTVAPDLMSASSAVLQCCVSNGDMNCTENPVAQDTVNVTQFVPPVLSIECTAQDNNIGPGDSTFIDISTEGLDPGDDACIEIIIQTSPFSELGVPDMMNAAPENVCTPVDANGNASIQFTGGEVAVADDATLRCYLDNIMQNNMFDPGEVSTTEVITVDPNAAPTPIQVACSPFPASILPGANSLITMTLMNAGTGTPVCFEFFSNTSPASNLSDDNEGSNTTRVCSSTNMSNQAFATFEANAAIDIEQNANILCCADTGGGMADMDCTPADPQSITAVEVSPAAPSSISIVSVGNLIPPASGTRFIDVSTNLPVPSGTQICMFKQSETTTDGDSLLDDSDESTTVVDPFPTSAANTICEVTTDDTGQINGDFNITIDDNADPGQTVTVQACIDITAGGACGLGEPLSNPLTFTVP